LWLDLLQTLEQGPSVGLRLGVRVARGRDDFPCRTRIGALLPFHLAGEQVQKIVQLCGGLIRNLIAALFWHYRCRELRRNRSPSVVAAPWHTAPGLTSRNLLDPGWSSDRRRQQAN
jgi:hypothetical protein